MRWETFRRGFQTLHLWAGLILCLPFVAIGLSGSLLLVQREFDAYSVPSAKTSGPQAPLARILEAAMATAAPDAIAARVELPASARSAAVVRMQTSERPLQGTDVFVDPVSLEILGIRPIAQRGPFVRQIINMHAFLMIPSRFGLQLVGWMAVAMTLMGASGLILWWPRKGFWRRAFWVRKGARGLSLNLDLHHTVGFWGLAVFLVMSVSGIYLTFPDTFRAAVRTVLPTGVTSSDPPAQANPPDERTIDQAVVSAQLAVANARARVVELPTLPRRPIVVEMETMGFGPGAPPILVTIDPDTGLVGYVDDPRTYALGDKVLNLQSALHFATGFGWTWKVLVFLSGLLPLALAITGVNIWWLRRRRRRTEPERGVVVAAE